MCLLISLVYLVRDYMRRVFKKHLFFCKKGDFLETVNWMSGVMKAPRAQTLMRGV